MKIIGREFILKILRMVRNLFKGIVFKFLRPLKIKMEVNKLNKRVVIHNTHEIYLFSQNDIYIHAYEKYCYLPKMFPHLIEDSNLLQVTIKDVSIFYPSELPITDLPWLYHEVFDDYKKNPSSYNNPNLDYESRSWIIDAGAAEGYFSIFALNNSDAKLLSIEPLPFMREPLMRTLSPYKKENAPIVISAALGEIDGWANLQIDGSHVCDSRVTVSPDELNEKDGNQMSCRVPLKRIDSLMADFGLGANGLIKMDIEGFEMSALRGGRELMRDCRPNLAIAVYHDFENARKCAEIIKAANSSYKIEFRGCYGYFSPPRPYMIFAY
jgi:FkbM family methyltransferase